MRAARPADRFVWEERVAPGSGAAAFVRALDARRLDLEAAIRRIAAWREAAPEGRRRDMLSLALSDLIAMRGHLAELEECFADGMNRGHDVSGISQWEATFAGVEHAMRELEAAAGPAREPQRPVAA